MRNIKGIIFDMDGCLYPFDRGSGNSFSESQFGQSIKTQELTFIQNQLGVDAKEAEIINSNLKERFNQHLSLALEYEHDIPRELFFNATWDLQPAQFIDKQPQLLSELSELPVCSALLTAAPKIWAERVLEYLGVRSHFGTNVLCGDQDVRKPDPQVFQQVADMLGFRPEQLISIGDQEHTDILPAQTLGMITVRIGGYSTNADFLASDIPDAINQLKKRGLL
ncbi:MAG TPA: HAD family hydrolase [Patescibacteria group bacterium]|nr:HAD family hydrolase [Patescibacteria group bacterium]